MAATVAELHMSAAPHVVNSVSNAPTLLVTPHRGGAVQLKCFLPATRPHGRSSQTCRAFGSVFMGSGRTGEKDRGEVGRERE